MNVTKLSTKQRYSQPIDRFTIDTILPSIYVVSHMSSDKLPGHYSSCSSRLKLFISCVCTFAYLSSSKNKSLLLTILHVNHANIREYTEHFQGVHRSWEEVCDKCRSYSVGSICLYHVSVHSPIPVFMENLNGRQQIAHIHTHNYSQHVGCCHDQCGLTQAHPNY